jgi:hypothetical protein
MFVKVSECCPWKHSAYRLRLRLDSRNYSLSGAGSELPRDWTGLAHILRDIEHSNKQFIWEIQYLGGKYYTAYGLNK